MKNRKDPRQAIKNSSVIRHIQLFTYPRGGEGGTHVQNWPGGVKDFMEVEIWVCLGYEKMHRIFLIQFLSIRTPPPSPGHLFVFNFM